MSTTYELSIRAPRFRANRLALCLMAALTSQMPAALALTASSAATRPLSTVEHRRVPSKTHSDQPAASWTVMNCSDHDTDSLRDIIKNHAQPGDIVDLSQLPALCGMADSQITLTSGEIAIAQTSLTLQGPDPATGTVKISGAGASRVFNHQGNGFLNLYSLTIADGHYQVDGYANGGCIVSNGSLYLAETVVTGCVASSNMSFAYGGGVRASSDVVLTRSAVSGNQAIAPSEDGFGGGIYASAVVAYYSSISNNVAQDGLGAVGSGCGGICAQNVELYASTIDHNQASRGSGLYLHSSANTSTIVNSTISENVTIHEATLTVRDTSLTIANSTIAFNHSNDDTDQGAVLGGGNSLLTLQSTIIANNTTGSSNTPADLYVTYSGLASVTGADNLVIASNVLDPTVITVALDPKLGPLQFNGGPTRTHALLPGSPAISFGNGNGLPFWMSNDQRGVGYPRASGQTQTIDIGAFQFDTIFAGGFDFQ